MSRHPLTAVVSLAFAGGIALAASYSAQAAEVIAVTEDVMTSSFFQGSNTVRGYAIENTRPVMRVSTLNPFGTTGAEAIYLSFAHDFTNYTGAVTATLTLQSAEGGFGADAGASTPFLVSAHGVDANPFTSIIDDTNPGGTADWLTFYNANILAADTAARTSINSFGPVTFDVSGIVNSWIAGTNTNQFIALTGKYDSSGSEFLHGFLNDNNGGTPMGYTYLTVAAVPEPATYGLLLAGLGVIGAVLRRTRRHADA